MKAISLFKQFTFVWVLVCGFHFEAMGNETEMVGGRAIDRSSSCSSLFPIPPTQGTEEHRNVSLQSQCSDAVSRLTRAYQEQQELRTQCNGLRDRYDQARTKSREECARAGQSLATCANWAGQCSGRGQGEGQDEFGDEMGIGNVLSGIAETFSGGGNAGTPEACYEMLLQNDNDARKEKERLDDRIARLQEQIQANNDKKAEQDDKLNQKRAEVEQKMLDAEQEVDKKKFERQTKNQQEAVRVGRLVIAAEKKKRENLNKINEKTNEMSNLSYAKQEIEIKFAQSEITTMCRERTQAYADSKIYVVDSKGVPITDKSGAKRKKKFNSSEARTLRQDVVAKEALCLRQEALKKSAQLKGISDTKRKLQAEIDNLQSEIVDEDKTIQLEQNNLEQLKAIATAEEAKDIENLQKKLNSLNKTVTDFEQIVIQKKRNLDQRNADIENQIREITAQRLNVANRYQPINTAIETSRDLAQRFAGQCCNTDSVSEADKTRFGCDAPDLQQFEGLGPTGSGT